MVNQVPALPDVQNIAAFSVSAVIRQHLMIQATYAGDRTSPYYAYELRRKGSREDVTTIDPIPSSKNSLHKP